MKRLNTPVLDLMERWFDVVQKATGSNLQVCCCFCYDKKFRLYVLQEGVTKGGRFYPAGTAYCQNESRYYRFVDVYQQKEGVTYTEAMEQLYSTNPEPRYSEIDEVWDGYTEAADIRDELEVPQIVFPANYHPLWNLSVEDWERLTPEYMKQRKITQQMCNEYLLGYCSSSAEWTQRMIVPICQYRQIVAYQGRAMYTCKEQRYKYLFNAGVNMGCYLFNLDLVPVESDSVILVEGVFDVWGVRRAGYDNVVASFGKHLAYAGRKKLVGRFKRVYLMWDDDAVVEIKKLADELEGLIEVYICSLKGKDPDEATTESVQEAISNAKRYSDEHTYDAMLAAMSMK
jgi:5S rRNA maturation endonuclease (ribonuclease M5)